MEIITSLKFSELEQLITDSVQKCFVNTLLSPTPILSDRIDLSEACNITGLKKSTIYRLSMDNKIPFQKYGKRLVFSRKSLLEWIESRTIGTQEASDSLMAAALKKLRK
jgi:excisionase family DNA binding protein